MNRDTVSTVNYYEILEVPTDAPQSDIHRAYQRARATYAPENPALYSMFTPEEAQELLRLVEEAWTVLGHFGKRKSYDEGIGVANSAALNDVESVPNSHSPSVSNGPTEIRSSGLPPRVQRLDGESSAAGEYVTRTKESAREPTPQGMGRTALGTYKIDDAVEKEISTATEYDGAFLQKIRIYKNITIERLSDATRISRTYLMAVETNNYKNLPAAVFVRGFVVQMARALGLDEAKVATSYMKAFKGGGGK